MNGTIENRYFPLDVIRLFACFAVIIVHVAAVDVSQGGFSRLGLIDWLSVLGLGSLGRSAVPLFIMISGALLLHHTRQHYGLYLLRKSAWILTVYLGAALGYIAISLSIEDGLFNEKRLLPDLLSGNGVPYFHLYFLLIILGLYLMTPLLSAIKTLSTQTITIGVAALALITNIDLLFREFQHTTIGMLGIYGKFIAYLPYFILGYLLVHRWQGSLKHNGWLAFTSLIAIWSIAALLSWQQSKWAGNVVFYYENILVMALSIGLFGFLYNAGEIIESRLSVKQKTWVTSLAKQTLWVYIIHIFILRSLQSIALFSPLQNWGSAALKVLVLSSITLIISVAISYIMQTTLQLLRRIIPK